MASDFLQKTFTFEIVCTLFVESFCLELTFRLEVIWRVFWRNQLLDKGTQKVKVPCRKYKNTWCQYANACVWATKLIEICSHPLLRTAFSAVEKWRCKHVNVANIRLLRFLLVTNCFWSRGTLLASEGLSGSYDSKTRYTGS